MNHVHHEQVAPGGYLHFDADANPRAIDNLALDPIDVSGDLLRPSAKFVELLVNQLPDSSTTV